jgi:hypothetical protein
MPPLSIHPVAAALFEAEYRIIKTAGRTAVPCLTTAILVLVVTWLSDCLLGNVVSAAP